MIIYFINLQNEACFVQQFSKVFDNRMFTELRTNSVTCRDKHLGSYSWVSQVLQW